MERAEKILSYVNVLLVGVLIGLVIMTLINTTYKNKKPLCFNGHYYETLKDGTTLETYIPSKDTCKEKK